jgi:hypothetical protein
MIGSKKRRTKMGKPMSKAEASKMSTTTEHLQEESQVNLRRGEYIVVVTPNTDNARKTGFVKVNGKVIPFNVRVKINDNDLVLLRRMHEYEKTSGAIDPREIMERLRIPQERANKVARDMESEYRRTGQMMNGKLNARKVPLYNVTIIKRGR